MTTLTHAALALLILTQAAVYGASVLAAEARFTPPTISALDLSRYQGRWYEIAMLPNNSPKICVSDVSATYKLRLDGTIHVVNTCRIQSGATISDEGVIRYATNAGNPGKLKVHFAPEWLDFLPFIWNDYWILDLSADYQEAMIGAPSKDYLWILARTPTLPEDKINALMAKAKRLGFNTAAIVRTKNTAPAAPRH